MTMRAARRLLHFGALAFLTVGVALGGQTAAELETALRLNPQHAQARENLRRARAQLPKIN